ncbi:ABC transporter substrate-binding protein [[Limnothrix rosea] IAM M-220]|uniref:ABC transporter substrate-binding protein n=1 Tax=[Limnothrix rosea] IAM M-220 TaxID=454133 RepID=UPI00095F8609|nr:ABC transporter substrate-binding protein [[Limnothrix rosea] IAM M-220]OKH17089.1 peptide ABC transporter substrate-binding protein [[Limnothrix rosea] IAM M-220]
MFSLSRKFHQLHQSVYTSAAIALVVGATLVGCNPAPQTDTNTGTSTEEVTTSADSRILVGTTAQPRTIDPADSYEIAGLNIIYNVTESLYTYDVGTTEIVPLLATELPTISEDGLTYTIPLREGVNFHDGEVFNAAAMKFSLDRFIQNQGKPSFLLGDIIESVEATGEYELTITLQRPFAAFPALLAFAGASAVSPAAYEIGAGNFAPNTLVGTGPYVLTEFNSDTIKLDRNGDYWGDAPRNAGVDLQIFGSNAANLFNSLRTGAVDIAYQSLEPEQITNLLADAEQGTVQALKADGTAVNFMVLNRNLAPLDQLEVRQAIAHLIDRDLINERVLQGQADPLYSLIPTSFPASEPTFQEVYGNAEIEAAKTLLTEAGFSAEAPAVVPLWYPSGSTTRGIIATTLKEFADRELEGMLVFEPSSVEGANFFKNIAQGVYPAALGNWYPDFLDADNYIHPMLDCDEGSEATGCESGGAQNQGSFYWSEKMNELIDAQRTETDPAARLAIFAEIQDLMAADVPYIPIWQGTEYVFAQSDIQGLAVNPSQSLPLWLIEK